ncbi:hypothetical protein [Sphingobium indicum]|uniref:hypothetical protein n=1 Tax=Sphingobium indicum TaxID=332055 RepID=UPI0018CA2316|nr:hypothetical protein [Sphingobium indicum]
MNANLRELIEASKAQPMSDYQKERQRRSFAYGNAHIENALVTRQMVDEAADKLGKHDK